MIALVTGSSRGLGFEIAKALDKKEISTLLTGRSKADVEQALKQLNPEKHRAFSLDFTKGKETEMFLAMLSERQIKPNILIHNLGGRLEGDGFPVNKKILKDTMDLNLEIAMKINEVCLPHMVEKKFGRIIHIGSDSSLTGQASPAYVIAKAALNGYVKTAARYYAKYNVMICAVLPGILEHEGSAWAEKKITQPEYYHRIRGQMPLGRFGQPDEIAGFVAELADSNSMMSAGGLFEFRGAIS